MSADLLRRAAALMRERAEAATDGAWDSAGGTIWGRTGLTVVQDPDIRGGDREHIASWHPPVSLDVASWLELEAEAPTRCDNCAVSHRSDFHRWRARAVARAYLGEQP